MTVTELQTQIDQAQATVRKLQKATLTPSGDIDADIELEARLGASQRLLARLETQLGELRARETADREEAQEQVDRARLAELTTVYIEGCSEVARLVNDAAKELEPVLSAVVEKRRELRQLDNEHYRLYKKLNGQSPDLDRLWSNINVVPGKHVPLPDYSPVVDHLGLALFAAISEKEGLPLTLRMIRAVLSGATMPRDLDNSPIPTPKPPADENLTPIQAFARGRRPNSN